MFEHRQILELMPALYIIDDCVKKAYYVMYLQGDFIFFLCYDGWQR